MALLRKWVGTVIVAAALVVLLTNLVGLQAETAEAAAPKKLWINPSEFVPATGSMTWINGGAVLIADSTLQARVHLPANKKIVGMTMYYRDNTDPSDLCATLTVQHAGTSATPTTLANNVCSSGAATTYPNSVSIAFSPYKLLKNDTPYVSVTFDSASFLLVLDSISIQYK
jgi:hypothetical protein